MSIAERLLLIAAGLLLTIPAEARSRCPPGEYWRPTRQGCSSKKDQPQFYTVRGSRFNTKMKLPQKPRKAGQAFDGGCPDREAGATFGAEVFWSLILTWPDRVYRIFGDVAAARCTGPLTPVQHWGQGGHWSS